MSAELTPFSAAAKQMIRFVSQFHSAVTLFFINAQ
jgi:hypothetical protein